MITLPRPLSSSVLIALRAMLLLTLFAVDTAVAQVNSGKSTKNKPAADAPAEPPVVDDKSIQFTPLELPAPVTAMALTEDGKYLVVSHQEADSVSIWNVVDGKVEAKLEIPAPRCVLCRGDEVYVAQANVPVLYVFSRAKKWAQVRDYDVNGSKIYSLSAPRGKNFKKDIVIGTMGGGIVNLDMTTKEGKQTEITRGALAGVATCSYDGKFILSQSSFSNSPAGLFEIFKYADLMRGGKPPSGGRGGELQTPFLDQVHPGTFWFGSAMAFDMSTLKRLPVDEGLIIPDFSQRVFYTLSPNLLRAHRIDKRLTEIGKRPVTWSKKSAESADGVLQTIYRHRSLILDIPSGVTMNGSLYLFAANNSQRTIWTAKIPPFAAPSGTEKDMDDPAPVAGAPDSAEVAKTSPDRPAATGKVTGKEAASTNAARGADGKTITFAPLDLPETVTEMALTEDGQYLVVTHQAANLVSIWDVAKGKLDRTLKTPSPRCVLCRGDGIYIGQATDGTIRFFSRAKDWSLIDEYDVKKGNIVALSAPRGEFFKRELLATCHGGGTNVVHLDTATDKHKIVSGKSVATYSYDGKLVVTQDSFRNSPAGTINVYSIADFLGGKPKEVLSAGESQTPFIDQAHPGLFWFGGSMVFGGASMKALSKGTGLIVPDLTQRGFYSLGATELRAMRLDSSLTEIERRKVEWTDDKTAYDGIAEKRERHRSYLVDIPSAATLNGALHLFVVNHSRGVIWTAKTLPFSFPASSETGPAATAKTDPAKPELNEWGLPDRIVDGSQFRGTIAGPKGAQYELLTGPQGLQVSATGELTWTPAASAIGIHELKIRVKAAGETSFARPRIEVIDHELVARSGGSLSVAEKGQRLSLDVDHYQFLAAANYRSLLLLQGDRLRVLGSDGLSVARELKLPARYLQLGVRHDKSGDETFVGLSKEPQQLDLIDGKSGKLRKSIPIQKSGVRVLEIMDVAVHPTRPLSYVTVKHDIELPRFRILVVDESTGKIEAPDDAIGTWVKVDPTGRYLFAAYKDLYQKGTRFHMNPGWNLITTPEYGNVDWLIVYELSGQKMKFQQVDPSAGGNGSGLVLSPDGKRITYLSHVGTPMFSKNLVGWNPRKLKEEPVTYPVKDVGTTQLLAFHPSLNLVAVPGGGSAVLFDRETGKLLDNKLAVTSKGLGDAKVERLLFSPDGKSLIFVCNDTEAGLYLRKVDLRLSAAELAGAAKGVAEQAATDGAAPAVVEKKNLIKVRREEIDSLKKTAGKAAISHAEIGRKFMNSVVVITTDEGSGTGFVVGGGGYVLTCAHVIPAEGPINVAYNAMSGGRPKTVTAKARTVRVEMERDLALLKFTPEGQMTAVAMSDELDAEAGEEVTVIGNPGLGSEILKHSVTTGVVSSPDRELDGLHYVQTSAAVNAGNSGGPVFGSKGQIVGLVVLKARLEATAFAVPTTDLRRFLLDATAPGR